MNIVLILSGGKGTRMKTDIPKQYITIKGKSILSFVLDVFEKHELVDKIQIVAADEWRNQIESYIGTKFAGFSSPGVNRQMSIYNGLKDIAKFVSDDDKVIVHDAARPFVNMKMITEILNALDECEAVIPVLPMKDTVYEVIDGQVTSLLDRNRIMAGQAPEGFIFGKYLTANEKLMPNQILKINGSMEAAYLYGMTLKCIQGDENNFKITTPRDLKRFEEIIKVNELN